MQTSTNSAPGEQRALSASNIVDLLRKRSKGVLKSEELAWCRKNGVPLAYDPVQIGWVTLECDDDIAPPHTHDTDEGIRFRPWSQQDAQRLSEMLSSEKLWEFLPEEYKVPIDEKMAAQLISISQEAHHYVVAVTKGDKAIGQARLEFTGSGEAEISYWLAEDHWGKGIGSAVVSAFSEQSLLERPDLDRLIARVHKYNYASRRILEKASFTQKGQHGVWLILERSRHR